MNKPHVTVALPIYNGETFLADCLRSVLSQTLKEFEVIVVLDGCTDHSAQIVNDLKDSRFVVIQKDHNEGLFRALNLIHERASAPLIARVDQDDVDHPERLDRQLDYMIRHPETDVLGTRFDYINERGESARAAKPFPLSHYRIKRDFQRYTPIGGPTSMYRLDRIIAAGSYREDYCCIEDVSLWLACLARGYRFANLPQVLVHYRVHATQTSTLQEERMLPQRKQAYAEFGPKIWGKAARPLEVKESKLQRMRRKVEDFFIP
ncbi:glycosyltransferase [candidate division KSB1 bacterium]|nr:MAG: glycosyltransferase [candidate division KSB1 bacterium]